MFYGESLDILNIIIKFTGTSSSSSYHIPVVQKVLFHFNKNLEIQVFWKILSAVENLAIRILWIFVKQFKMFWSEKIGNFLHFNTNCVSLIDWLKVAENKWIGQSIALSDFYDLPLDEVIKSFGFFTRQFLVHFIPSTQDPFIASYWFWRWWRGIGGSEIPTWSELPHDKTNKVACVPGKDSDQPGHPPTLIRVFAVRMKRALVLSYPLRAQRKLIRLGGCPGWSESSLGAQSFCWFCHEAAHLFLWVCCLLKNVL